MRRMFLLAVLAICAAAASGSPLFAQSQPILSLDTGGHMALIRETLFTPDGGSLISVSDDKAVRIWDLASGKTVRTIRGETGEGEVGKILAMALSPDGRWLAAAGRLQNAPGGDYPIRIYDFRSGALAALLHGHSNAILALAFSPDGKMLASGSIDKRAMLWDVEKRSRRHVLAGHKADINRLAFTRDGGTLATGSDDRRVMLWRTDNGRHIATSSEFQGRIYGIAPSPVAGEIAISTDAGELAILDGRDARTLRAKTFKGTSLMSLKFAPDGKSLLSGAGLQPFYCTVFSADRLEPVYLYRGHDQLVMATAISPDGRLAVTAGGQNNEIHLWDFSTGALVKALRGTGAAVLSVGFSKDGGEVAFGQTSEYRSVDSRGPLEIVLPLRGAQGTPLIPRQDMQRAREFAGARLQLGELSMQRQLGGKSGYLADLVISRRGQPVATIHRDENTEFINNSFTFTPDAKFVISGAGSGALTIHDTGAARLGAFTGHTGDVWAVATSPDGKLLASGSDDQTMRLWNVETREPIVTLFYGKDGAWVMWTPQGYFASSPGGDALVGWQINRGPDKAAEYVNAGQLRRKLNRPDIVEQAIKLASAGRAVKEAQGATFKIADLFSQPVPAIHIEPFPAGYLARGGLAELTLTLADTPDPVKTIRLQVDGRQIDDVLPVNGPGFKPGTLKFKVPLAKGRNTITVTALNDTGEASASIEIEHEGDGLLDKRGTLYILAVGVDKYPGLPGNDLNYSGADARSFADAMEKRAGPLHEAVVRRVLVNGAPDSDAPTAANIVDALDVLKKATENDTVMLFVAGHGVNEGAAYRFVPTDAIWTENGNLRSSTLVPWYAFQDAIEGAKGVRILFLDTCHSANAYNPRILNESVHANIVVYTSARWDQEANEAAFAGEGHGLFTKAVVEGVQGGAGAKDGEVRVEALRDYVRDRVKTLTAELRKASQEPQFYRGRDAENYLLARAK